ncbi:MAG TPA: glycosyltransferase family 2 protein [Myxococcales bacterium]
MIGLALVLCAIPVLVACGYLGFLALAARRLPERPRGTARIKFDLVVPAHDEETGIAATLRSLAALDYPKQLFRVLVVADNCSDRTAEVAAAEGAVVLVRNEPTLRGKGYALARAFEQSAKDAFAEAVVVIDADTSVSPALLRGFAAGLEAKEEALQADYAVRNPSASWRTRLMHIALSAFHVERSLARERLGLSAGLRGNGMCFTHALLRAFPWNALSIVEDVEFGIRLGEGGRRVAYVDEEHVYGEMVSSASASGPQRRRWEDGRKQLVREKGPRLLRLAFTRKSGMLLDLALDLYVPPLARLAFVVSAGLCASGACVLFLHQGQVALFAWAFAALLLAAHVARGWQLSGTGAAGLLDLLRVPTYMLWKARLLFGARGRSQEWVRTARQEKAP